MLRHIALLSLLGCCLALSDVGGHWSYDKSGADWGGMCSSGKRQSPVNVETAKGVNTAPVKGQDAEWARRIKFAYKNPTNAVMTNNGHAIQVNGKDFGHVQIRHTVLQDDRKTMQHQWHNYSVKQFHFHSPSEHTINGKRFELEMHIVHQRDGASGTDGLAVVGVMFDTMGKGPNVAGKKQGDASKGVMGSDDDWGLEEDEGSGEAFLQLWETVLNPLEQHAQQKQDDASQDAFLAAVQFDKAPRYGGNNRPLATAPSLGTLSDTLNGAFFYYSGSLTTPPCSEWVRWHVFPKVHPMSSEQLTSISRAFAPGSKGFQKGNYRAVQPMNERKMYVRPSVADLKKAAAAAAAKPSPQPSTNNTAVKKDAAAGSDTKKATESKDGKTEASPKAADTKGAADSKSADKKETTDSKSVEKKETTDSKSADKKETTDSKSADKKETSDSKASDTKGASDAKSTDKKETSDSKSADTKDATDSKSTADKESTSSTKGAATKA